ncbi:LysR family transcriptional regulator [Thioclava sp. BHET1]|nr:LysR family transcriptional regulator [Thioclava sp. BHET1]
MLYLTLRQLEYVAACGRAASLTEAARLVNVSQPSLSVALSQVEAHLGQALFLRRKGAKLAPTPFGRRYLAEVEQFLASATRLDTASGLADPLAGAVTLGCFADLAPGYLAPLLSHLRSALPGLTITPRIANFETLARGLLDGQIDLALTYDLGLDASFERRELRRHRPHAFLHADHPLAARPVLRLADLAAEPLILFDEGLSARHMLALFRARGLHPRVAHRVGALEVMRSLAAHGEGAGLSYTAPPTGLSYDGRALHTRPIADPEAEEPVILARARHGVASPLDIALMTALTGAPVFATR